MRSGRKSRPPKKKSNAALEQRATDSVFDILYHDAARISSFLAQFDQSGSLQSVKQISSAEDAQSSGYEDNAGVSVALARGGTKDIGSETQRALKSSEKIYDTTFANSLEFLDQIDAGNLLERDFSSARIGQFVLARGQLNIIDLNTLKAVWQSEMAQTVITLGAVAGGMEALSAQMIFQIIPALPHAIQAQLNSDGRAIWSALRSEGLITPASDLLLKHGAQITGIWSMVGILDALPDTSGDAQLPAGLEGMMEAVAKFSAGIRGGLGRPASSFGMTPLIIFREVGRPTSLLS